MINGGRMRMETIRILAVDDPAVQVYVDQQLNILGELEKQGIQVLFDIVPWEKYFKTMLNAFVEKGTYDIIMVAGHLWLADFVSKGYLSPLQYDKEDILPVIAEEMEYEGKTYLSPSFCDGHMIAYRKSMVEKVMGHLPNSVMTPDEVVELADKLKDLPEILPIALKAHVSEILTDAIPYLRSTSPVDVYEIGQEGIRCNIGSMAAGMEKYIQLKELTTPETSNYGNLEIKDLFAKKKVAMATTWSGQMGVVMRECIDKEDVGFATFTTAWNVTWSFAINNTSLHKEAAEKVLDYLRSSEIDEKVGEWSGAPIRRQSYEKGKIKYPWYSVQLEMIQKYAKPFPHVIGAGAKNDILYQTLHEIFIGKKHINAALIQAQEQVNAI